MIIWLGMALAGQALMWARNKVKRVISISLALFFGCISLDTPDI